jgi:predicted transcriptional regulator
MRKRLTQQELARQTQVPRTYLAKLEAGLITVTLLERVLRVLRRLGAEVTVTYRPPDDDAD